MSALRCWACFRNSIPSLLPLTGKAMPGNFLTHRADFRSHLEKLCRIRKSIAGVHGVVIPLTPTLTPLGRGAEMPKEEFHTARHSEMRDEKQLSC